MTLEEVRFTPEVVAELAGPTWLREHRLAAITRLDSVTEATERVEEWRYGRIDELDIGQFPLLRDLAPAATDLLDRTQEFLSGLSGYGALVRVLDGQIVMIECDAALEREGVAIRSIAASDRPNASLGRLLAEVDESFAVMNDALCADILQIAVPAGVALTQPIVIVSELSDAAGEHLSLARTLIELGDLAEATVIIFQSSTEAASLHIPVVEAVLAQGAQLRLDQTQHLGGRAWQLGYQLCELSRDARLFSFAAALGGSYARLYTRAKLVGENAESVMYAAYLGVGDQVQDFRTFQDHVVGRTRSDLVFKGAVADHARSVYSGMIHMHRDARRAEASQTNRNLVLSEGAHADSVPNLEIEENDVRCSHASAVGPIDPDELFYLATRGIAPEVAERLILLGFFDDLLSRTNSLASAQYVREEVAKRLALNATTGRTTR